ncbi:hypothetical protein Dimus_017757, partial [Dionaea muscipula]
MRQWEEEGPPDDGGDRPATSPVLTRWQNVVDQDVFNLNSQLAPSGELLGDPALEDLVAVLVEVP